MLDGKQQAIVDKGSYEFVNGWHHLKVKGTPYECGFQHGYFLADALKDALRVYDYMTLQTFGVEYKLFRDAAVRLHKDKIPPYQLEELQGMAEGFTAGGTPMDVDDMIGWNAWMELTDYWWPLVADQYANNPPKTGPRGSHCSGFVATGSYTKDGRPVTVRVPLNAAARAILARYDDPTRKTLLPFISAQHYNGAIRKAFLGAGLNRPVQVLNPITREPEIKPLYSIASSHMARRTFIGNLYKQVKDPNLIARLSGHTEGSAAFARYRDIDEEMKVDLVKLLE